MITIEVENKEIKGSLLRLSALTKKPMETLVKQSARRVCVNLCRTIAPFGFEESAKQAGIKAIRNDYKITTLIRDESFIDLVRQITGTDRNIVQQLNRKDGTPYVIDWQEVSKAPARVFQHHESRRSKRTGRVGGGRSVKGRSTMDIGRHRADTKIVTTPAAFDKSFAKSIRNVGLAKYAYAQAAKSLGGTRGIPSWVKKSRGKPGAGTAQSTITKGGYSIVITNHVPYASRILSTAGERDSLQREADYLRREVDAKITGRWKR
jgi:hypothetical protein